MDRKESKICPTSEQVCPEIGLGRSEISVLRPKDRLARFLQYSLRMTNKNNRFGCARGSMMLEYVVVLCGIAVSLIVFMNRSFYSVGKGFGPLGQSVVAFYQRLQGGLSLPVP